MIQRVGSRPSPLIVSALRHTSTQYLSKHVASEHFPPLRSLSSSSSYQPSPPSLPLSWILERRHKGNIKLTVTDSFFLLFVLFCFINEILQVDVCEHIWKIHTRRNVSNPAVECGGMFKKLTSSSRKYKRKTNLNDIGSSPETLSRYGRARLLPANTGGLVEVVRIPADLKHVLVFHLHWLLGRLFEQLIKLCEHSGRPCWDVFVSWA